MDVATAWIGNNILSVDFDHFFEYSLDKINILALGTCTQTLFSQFLSALCNLYTIPNKI